VAALDELLELEELAALLLELTLEALLELDELADELLLELEELVELDELLLELDELLLELDELLELDCEPVSGLPPLQPVSANSAAIIKLPTKVLFACIVFLQHELTERQPDMHLQLRSLVMHAK
jgi:hypothetical protein